MCSASVSIWIHYAMGPLIQELDITLYTIQHYYFSFPNNLSECSNLVSLSLKGALCFARSWAKSFSLPSLKKLVLDICGIDVDCLNAFLEGCPCLETMDFYWYVEDYGTICVPPLCLPTSLKTLKIVVLKHLRLSRSATKQLRRDVAQLHFPKFDNLLHLNLNLLRFNSNIIMSLLQICHSLEVLIIQTDEEVCNDKECQQEQSSLSKWVAQPSVPSCLESHLNFIQFKGYRGFTDELYFAEYILQKGCVLKTMIISDISTDLKEKFDTLKRLSNVPRASTMCQLTFD
ncbi:putative FBD-associated F-box protein At5g56820 isoform X1 [Vicia villosa]|uniref:putative FBD-associated F-box protein At5g56820 isoform X1 n=1 Tax=Vicia villosa TaxID=3911 RepID=UPI00273C3CD7|nr:putative FBD-associated F-box protein At5g56820 isoform X1 [Vicia villosa]